MSITIEKDIAMTNKTTKQQNNVNLHITSEIAPLQSVLLKRPGGELCNLIPEALEELLFDDIPFLEVAQKEHDAFAGILKQQGIDVFYLDDLVGETLQIDDVKDKFIADYLIAANIYQSGVKQALTEYLSSFSGKALCEKIMSGVKKAEVDYKAHSLAGQVEQTAPFWLQPIPNLYFTRDPGAVFGNMVSLNKMYAQTRRRESLFIESIFTYHPKFQHNHFIDLKTKFGCIEGGDILVLDQHTLAVGLSQRTSAQAIQDFCESLFFDQSHKAFHQIKKVIVFHIPSSRAFMHLDTVMTQVDVDKCSMHKGIVGHTDIYKLMPGSSGNVKCYKLDGSIESVLSNELDKKIQVIYCGGSDRINASREQWSDGANTLAIKPGEVIVYQRNLTTNKALQDHGIKVHQMPCSELSRGRGGPRCMSMPLVRGK
ncbi:arginine deiminase [Facilibium subflavum]|uniref:arginine deiminase n=1 Tax=Facilibium subflavum TaxID=2219058 RepID=UPI000E64A83B|nr:arginine deiminase [Facilibium subflavum]